MGHSLTWRGKDEVLSRGFCIDSSGKFPEVIKKSSWRLIVFSLVTGAGMNFKPRDSKVICSSVFHRVLICCLRDSMLFCISQGRDGEFC